MKYVQYLGNSRKQELSQILMKYKKHATVPDTDDRAPSRARGVWSMPSPIPMLEDRVGYSLAVV